MLAPFVAFVRLSRLKFLVGGLVGGLFGTAIAAFEGGQVGWGAYAAAQATITAFHLMTHYSNDYFDRRGDVLGQPTAYAGGSGVLASGALAPVVALRAALACAAAGVAGALALAFALRLPAAALLALVLGAGAWSYSSPPLRLLARGLGELDTALVVGVLVPLCAYAAQTGRLGWPAIAATLPGAAAMFAMMLAVEFPDRDADEACGKRTLVVRLGNAAAVRLGYAAAAAAYAAVALAWATGAPPAYTLLEAFSVPLALVYVRALAKVPRAAGAAGEAAARGVAFFVAVTFLGTLGFAAAAAVETKQRHGAVDGNVIEMQTLEARVDAALEEVRPAIHRDGGDVWLIRVDAGVAYVQMVGACGGCAMSTATLKGAIESAVRARCPEIVEVAQI